MNRKILSASITVITIMVVFSACGIKRNTNNVAKKIDADTELKTGEEESKHKEYEISKEIYTDGDLRVEYPQINNLADQEKQEEINDIIKNKALETYQKTMKGLEPNEKYEVDGKYEIKYKSQNLLSIAYSSYNNFVPSVHPYYLFYTTNIDMKTGKLLFLKDFVPVIDKSFANLLKKAKYVGEIGKEYEQKIRESAFSQYESDEKLIDLLSSNSIDAYVTKDALGISMPVSHPAGDHAEFEISIDDLKDFIKFDQN